MENLKNKNLLITVSDPWDWGTEHGCGPFEVVVFSEHSNHLLLKLIKPLNYKNEKCEYFIASSRYDKDIYNELKIGNSPSINIIKIDENKALSRDPFNLDSWRGGIALIGSIESIKS